jgi:hypothetical protein
MHINFLTKIYYIQANDINLWMNFVFVFGEYVIIENNISLNKTFSVCILSILLISIETELTLMHSPYIYFLFKLYLNQSNNI